MPPACRGNIQLFTEHLFAEAPNDTRYPGPVVHKPANGAVQLEDVRRLIGKGAPLCVIDLEGRHGLFLVQLVDVLHMLHPALGLVQDRFNVALVEAAHFHRDDLQVEHCKDLGELLELLRLHAADRCFIATDCKRNRAITNRRKPLHENGHVLAGPYKLVLA